MLLVALYFGKYSGWAPCKLCGVLEQLIIFQEQPAGREYLHETIRGEEKRLNNT